MISREGQFASYAWRYPSSFCCESESLLTNHGEMQISQPPYLPDLMPADACSLKWKPPPFRNQRGKISGHRRQQEQHNCRLKGVF